MAKWRDVKKGRVLSKKEASTSSKTSDAISASIALRLKAFLTDTFLITTPIFYVVIYFIMGGGEEFAQNRTMGWTLIFLVHSLVILLFWLKKAQTPGLKAYSLKLHTSNKQQNITFIQALIRYFATLIAVISVLLLFIPFFRHDKRTFQDIFSNTHIVLE
jgi:uncharacterized RDD family membrane protein YckC